MNLYRFLWVRYLVEYKNKVKSFAETYRESRYNRDKTTYIPNFDQFTLKDQIDAIALIQGTSPKTLVKYDREKVDRIFWAMIKR